MAKGLKVFGLIGVVLFLGVSASGVYAYYPPDPSLTYHGDADGDEYLMARDVLAHETQANGAASSDYHTLQPNNDDDRWNTCDVDGDQYCTALDLPYLYTVANGGVIDWSPFGDTWAVTFYNQAPSYPANQWNPFQLSVHADAGFGQSGRPGMIVTVTIVSEGSTTSGVLKGRSCTPDYGDYRDQLNTDSQCAVGVSISQWMGAHPEEGLTENADYPDLDPLGLQIQADAAGTIHIHAEVAEIASFLIPAFSNDFYIYFEPVGEPSVRYVDAVAGGADDGASWADAFTVIQDAMDAASSGDVIWVAEGTYTRAIGGNEPVLGMKSGVEVYGGFVGTESNLSERGDPAEHPTVLDGENASYHVVVGASNARLDGFTITGGATFGGKYPDDAPSIGGGGMLNHFSSPTIANCIFTGNRAVVGGGICNSEYSSPTITNCIFAGNSAEYQGDAKGGGIYNFWYSSPTITNCTFTGNSADNGGGIASDYWSLPIITDCAFAQNSASTYGGGIMNIGDSPTITNCTFTGNSAVLGGGITNYAYSTATITKSKFTGNSAEYNGGGIYNEYSNPTITNCIFNENSAIVDGGGVYNLFGYDWYTFPAITNCTFTENVAYWGRGGGIFNSDSSPAITNCILWNDFGPGGAEVINEYSYPTVTFNDVEGGYSGEGNIYADPLFVSGDDVHLQPTSPCIDAGTNAGAPEFDLDGNPRPFPPNVNVAMGAYEYRLNTPDCGGIHIACSTPVDELVMSHCSITTDCTPVKDAGYPDTCSGVLTGGSSPYDYAFLPTESQGPGACVAAVMAREDNSIKDQQTVSINEVNMPPNNNAPTSMSGNELTTINFSTNPTDPDIPVQTLTSSVVSNGCPGGSLAGHVWSWTPTEAQGPTQCDVVTRVYDGVAYSNQVRTTITVNEVNMPPNNNAPTSMSVNELTKISFSTNPTDPDIPVQTLTSSVVSNGCPGGSLAGHVWSWTPTEAQGPTQCDVVTRVYDGVAYSNQVVTTITVNEVNQNPTWNPAPSDIRISMSGIYNQTNGHAVDSDLPAQTLSCSNASQTCSFTVTVSGSGTGAADCNISFTAPEAPTSCYVNIQASDSLGGTVYKNTKVIVKYPPIAISAGATHTCALTTVGGAKCWGSNEQGQLGDNGASGWGSEIPVDVFGLSSGVVAISAGGGSEYLTEIEPFVSHTCAVTSGGGVKCWGDNYFGQLGDNSTTNRLTPVSVCADATCATSLTGVIAVSAGGGHTCALTSGGGVKCWGQNSYGQLGDNSYTQRLTPVNVYGLSSGVTAISAGGFHTCAVTSSGGVKCWGIDVVAQLGNNPSFGLYPPMYNYPVNVCADASCATSLTGVTAISAGAGHTCALTSTGGVKCWGYNYNGELGDNKACCNGCYKGILCCCRTPSNVFGLSSGVMAITAGGHTCALTSGGGAKCWGYNGYGEIGDNSITNRWTPVNVCANASCATSLTGVTAIDGGEYHTCSLMSGGGPKCWGDNEYGQLGDNSTTIRLAPVDVSW